MFRSVSGDLATVLAEASAYPDALWRLWRFSAAGRVLVLCGYRMPFDRIGYLLFRGPQTVCLPWSVSGARFSLDAEAWARTHAPSRSARDPVRQRWVVVRSGGRTYHVVCDDVAFYRADPPRKATIDVP